MNTTTKISALLLCAAMLLSNTEIKADELNTRAKLIIAGAATLVAGWGALYARKSEKEFRSRFSREKTRNVRKMFTKDYIENIWYFIADEIIGQRKQSSTLKVKADGKIYPSEDTPAYGVLGTVDSYAAPLAESAKKFMEPFAQAAALWLFVRNFATNPSVDTLKGNAK